ncbi:MAG: hypothetical protein HYX99_04910 [Chloroflexi bacterium]|nr:hypothetical protein [Chloroflexota bacterium]
MDGREPVGIGYTPSYCADPADEPEFNRWYKEVHFVDVVKAGFLSNAKAGVLTNPLMFHNALAPLPPGRDKFLIMYEIYQQDIAGAMGEWVKYTPKLRQDYDQTKGIRSPNRGTYRVLRRVSGSGLNRRSQSLLAHRVNCSDPARLEELRRWFSEVRVPEVVATGLYHTGTFGELVERPSFPAESPGQTRFLALYESADADANGLSARVAQRFPLSGYPGYVKIMEDAAFRRDSP